MVIALLLLISLLSLVGYLTNVQAARLMRQREIRPRGMDRTYGLHALLTIALPGITIMCLWLLLGSTVVQWLVFSSLTENEISQASHAELSIIKAEILALSEGRIFGDPQQYKIVAANRLNELQAMGDILVTVCIVVIGMLALVLSRRKVATGFTARPHVESIIQKMMMLCSLLAVVTTLGIVLSLLFESLRFFAIVSPVDFLLGLNWEPQVAMREDQIASNGAFGWLPVLLGTLLITLLACLFAIPVGIATGIFLHEFAGKTTRAVIKPTLEILAGIPTVVYGFFAILVVSPAMREAARWIGIDASPNMALVAGLVMGIMLIPFISSFTDDALDAIPRNLRDGSLALGATRAETVIKVLFPAALPGIMGAVLLAVSRGIGETMIVVMAAGLLANLTFNPMDSVTTITVQIVTLLTGDTEFDNPRTLSAFALGLMLFLMTLFLNVLALGFVRKYREKYE